jgi:hypothetical protein
VRYVLVAESKGERGAPRVRHREVVYITEDRDSAEHDAIELTTKSKRYYVMTHEQVVLVAPAELATYERAQQEATNGS